MRDVRPESQQIRKEVDYAGFTHIADEDARTDMARKVCQLAAHRRSVRNFSARPICRQVIEQCLATANTAPSGANLQPWHFTAIANPRIKKRIRIAAEQEEREFYSGRAPPEWLNVLAPIGTDAHKPFLETAPWLIAVFAQAFRQDADGARGKNYYVAESVGIAVGLLISALSQCGISTLTHTPSPMGFLNEILERPRNERPYLLLVAGFPADNCRVPELQKKSVNQVSSFLE